MTWRLVTSLLGIAMIKVKNIPGHLFAVYAIVVFILTMLLIWLPVWVISFLKEPIKSAWLHRIFRFWMGIYLPAVFCPVSRRGKENFEKNHNYVVVLNHNSFMDIPVSSPWIPGPNKTLAKAEMAKTPLFGVIYRAGSILVDRKDEASRRSSFTRMQEALQAGLHLCLYPEGTRNKTTELIQPFFDGAFVNAIRGRKHIIPGLIFNTGVILPHDKKFWMRPKRIHIHFLEPISAEGYSLKEAGLLKEKVFNIMKEYYAQNIDKL